MKIIRQSFIAVVLFLVLCGFIYPLIVNVIGNTLFKKKAEGSLITYNNEIVGSLLIGQEFKNPKFFHGRISAVNYSTENTQEVKAISGGSNLAVTNPKLKDRVEESINEFLKNNPTVNRDDIPVDLVSASGSGLDPHISVASAAIQADRISSENNISKDTVLALIDKNKEGDLVNVLKLNLALLDSLN